MTMLVSEEGTRRRQAGVVALAVASAHAMNDVYSAFLHPLLPRIMAEMGLSIALAATLAMTLSLAASLLQPVMGILADRYGARLFVIAGPLMSGVFLSLIGVAPSFTVLLVLLTLGGLGSAAFHPPGAAMAAGAVSGAGGGARLSVFSFGGAAGYAMGPLIAVALVSWGGLQGLWVAMLPVLLLTPVLMRVLPPVPPRPRSEVHRGPLLPSLTGALAPVFVISAVAAFVQRVFLTMQPIAMAQAGRGEATGALVLSVYLGAQAVGSLTGGTLADRMDRRRLLFTLTTLSLPAHLLAVGLPAASPAALAATMLAGFLNMAVLPPIVLTAQQLMPGRTATSSGIVMGLAWATGSIFVFGTGALGDAVGARQAALLSFPLLLVACIAALHPAIARVGSAPAPASADDRAGDGEGDDGYAAGD